MNSAKDNEARFDRNFFQSSRQYCSLGNGEFGAKANGLLFIKKFLDEKINHKDFPSIEIAIPKMVILSTEIFDLFIQRNNLFSKAIEEESDENIVQLFLNADFPAEFLGDLRGLIENVHVPLAIRSSSKLEDAKYEPFAGIYATKMISNNQPDNDTRFHKLIEAIKFIYASLFFKESKDYFEVSSHKIEKEKMAVIIQEVVGQKFNERFYPNISGVARSYNFYPIGRAKPEDGIVSLALGLGKTIVDGGIVWNYCPLYPNFTSPFADPKDLIRNSQNKFWAINLSHFIEYNPIKETEYMIQADLKDADYDDTLKFIASTYDASLDKIIMGTGNDGPRIINFSPLLSMNEFKFNDLMKKIIKVADEAYNNPVEIEFAASIDQRERKMKFGFLQVRPMVVSYEEVNIKDDEQYQEEVLVASKKVMGNGKIDYIKDIVFVKPEKFDKKDTKQIASQIAAINKKFVQDKKSYLLIGFGRWGSSDPWLGIPVEWGQISAAKVIVESTLFGINVELSQGSHFFHNLSSFGVSYFSINFDGEFQIDWQWLNNQKVIEETEFVKHIQTEKPLTILIDGKTSRGVIKK